MLYFTKYAENKFDILNKHKVFITKEQVEGVVSLPDKTRRKGKNYFSTREGVEVIWKKEADIIKILTFYPIK